MAAAEAAQCTAFALSFPAAGFLIDVLGVRGVYGMAAAGCALAAVVLVAAMRELARSGGDQPATPATGAAQA